MSFTGFLGLFMTLIALAATPGPGVLATVAAALSPGIRASMAVITGIVAGHLVFVLLSVVGLSVAIREMGAFFWIIKWLAGVYLIGLGLKTWFRKAARPVPDTCRGRSFAGNVLQGFLITLSNPKAILFYCAVFPTFLGISTWNEVEIAALSGTVAVAFFGVLSMYACTAFRARRLFAGARAQSRVSRISGGIMMAAGAAVLFSRR